MNMRIYKYCLAAIILSLISCLGMLDRLSGVTIEKIKTRGKLIAVTSYGANNYFVYKGEPFGFEYEMLQLLADELGVELEIKLTDGRVPLLDILNSDYGDIVASSITITKRRRRQYNFTKHFMTTKQVLVQQKRDEGLTITDVIDLIGKEVTVIENSHYQQRLKNLSEEIGGDIVIKTVKSDVSEEDLIKMVHNGEIEYTVVDETLAIINKFYYQNINISTDVSFPQRIAWVVRRKSPEFREFVDQWLLKIEREGTIEELYNKYYRINRVLEDQLAFSGDPALEGTISAYDGLMRKYAYIVNWDWRLIAALIYQESRFIPTARSWAGAGGLMQLMPQTAALLGVSNRFDPDQNIFGGVRHLKSLSDIWEDLIPGRINRLKFILASYNAGVGHVRDAQRLAAKYGRDPKLWDDNVDYFILKLANPEYYNDSVVQNGYCRGSEPYNYVRIILDRFVMYEKHIPLIPQHERAVLND